MYQSIYEKWLKLRFSTSIHNILTKERKLCNFFVAQYVIQQIMQILYYCPILVNFQPHKKMQDKSTILFPHTSFVLILLTSSWASLRAVCRDVSQGSRPPLGTVQFSLCGSCLIQTLPNKELEYKRKKLVSFSVMISCSRDRNTKWGSSLIWSHPKSTCSPPFSSTRLHRTTSSK